MEQENSNKLRTVALRIMPALTSVFALILCLAAPAAASGFDYNDHIVSIDNGYVASFIPTTQAHWNLVGYPSMDWLADDTNPAVFVVDHSQINIDYAYGVVCDAFGSYGLDVTGIPNGSVLSFEFDVNVDQPEESYGSVDCHLHIKYYSADNTLLSTETSNIGTGFSVDGFVFDDFVVNKPAGADHIVITFYFLGFDLVNYGSGTQVTFSLDEILLVVHGEESEGYINIWDYDGSYEIYSFIARFPCDVYVLEESIKFVGVDGITEEYPFGGTGLFSGISIVPNDTAIRYPPGSSFTLYGESDIYLIAESCITGSIDIYDASGNIKILSIADVYFPCKVHVVEDALWFYYAGSYGLSFTYPFGGTGAFAGVSLLPYDTSIFAPGSTFTLNGSCSLYLRVDGDIPNFDIFDPDSPADPPFDLNDVDSSQIIGWFSGFASELNLPFTNVFLLFWHSELLHNIVLMAAIFSVVSYVIFGGKE